MPDDLVQTIAEPGRDPRVPRDRVAVPFIGGVIGWVDLTDRGVSGTLDSLRGGPGGEWLVGIATRSTTSPTRTGSFAPTCGAAWLAIGAADLAYDLLVRPRRAAGGAGRGAADAPSLGS